MQNTKKVMITVILLVIFSQQLDLQINSIFSLKAKTISIALLDTFNKISNLLNLLSN